MIKNKSEKNLSKHSAGSQLVLLQGPDFTLDSTPQSPQTVFILVASEPRFNVVWVNFACFCSWFWKMRACHVKFHAGTDLVLV